MLRRGCFSKNGMRFRGLFRTPTALAGSGWTPFLFTGLTGWYRGDNTVGGATATQWTDLSNNSRHFNLSGGAVAPSVGTSASLNNQSAISFNGSTNALDGPTLTNFITASAGTILAVVRTHSAATTGMIVSSNYAASNRVSIEAAGANIQYLNYDGTIDIATRPLTTSTNYKLEWSHSGGTLTVRANSSSTSVASGDTTTPLSVAVRLCGHPGNGGFYAATFAELVFLNQAMSAGDRAKWDAYVLARYGI